MVITKKRGANALPNPGKGNGLLILELALVMALISLFITPLIQLQKTNRAALEQRAFDHEVQVINQAIQGFIMSRGRLPCPATDSSFEENRVNEQCTGTGQLPLATLGLPAHSFKNWRLIVATLESAGSPAAHQLFKDDVFEELSLQAFTEILLQPETPSNGLDKSALPAIHLCLFDPEETLPSINEKGCGNHPLHSPTAVAVFYPANLISDSNLNRTHQFFLEPHIRRNTLNWISFEQFVWLRTMSGHSI